SGAGSSSALSPLSAGGRRGSGPHAVSDRAAPATNVPKAIRPDSMRRVSDNMETPLDRLRTYRAKPGLSKQMHTALGRFHLSWGQGGNNPEQAYPSSLCTRSEVGGIQPKARDDGTFPACSAFDSADPR